MLKSLEDDKKVKRISGIQGSAAKGPYREVGATLTKCLRDRLNAKKRLSRNSKIIKLLDGYGIEFRRSGAPAEAEQEYKSAGTALESAQ